MARGIVYEKVNKEVRSVIPKFCESGTMMPFAANSTPKKIDSCDKNIGSSSGSQLVNRRKIETEKRKSIFLNWLKGFF